MGRTNIIHMLGINPFHAQSFPSQKRILRKKNIKKEMLVKVRVTVRASIHCTIITIYQNSPKEIKFKDYNSLAILVLPPSAEYS